MDQHAGGSALGIMTGEGGGGEGRGRREQEEKRGRRIRQREKSDCNSVSGKASATLPPALSGTGIGVRVPGLSTLCGSVPGCGVSQEEGMTLGETALFSQLRAV